MPPFHWPTFDRAYVVSDLHMGGAEPDFQMFRAGGEFGFMLDEVSKELKKLRRDGQPNASTVFVINGDFVDFLAEPNSRCFNPDRAAEWLREILHRPEFVPVAEGLRKFVATPGAFLAITLGNHDLELALPEVRETLLDELTDHRPELRGKIGLYFDGWGYRFQVAGKKAVCVHGNEVDSANFTRYDELQYAAREWELFGDSEFARRWVPSAGTWLVINAMNPIKKQYPFIDLLKPETGMAIPLLAVMDPRQAKYIDEGAKLLVDSVRNEQARPDSQRRLLGAGGVGAAVPPLAAPDGRTRDRATEVDLLEAEVERALADDTLDELIRNPAGSTQMLGWESWRQALRDSADWVVTATGSARQWVRETWNDATRRIHFEAVLKTARRLQTTDGFSPAELDSKSDLTLDATIRGGYDVVFAGHTHFRRIATRASGKGLHVNTGTWAGLIVLTTRDTADENRFRAIYDALFAQSRVALENVPNLVQRPCTVARVAPSADGSSAEVSLGGVRKDQGAGMKLDFPERENDVRLQYRV